jgi:hypothetical protein
MQKVLTRYVILANHWGVVQLVGHLTVNEDGEGSNPSAPAKFLPPHKQWLTDPRLRAFSAGPL